MKYLIILFLFLINLLCSAQNKYRVKTVDWTVGHFATGLEKDNINNYIIYGKKHIDLLDTDIIIYKIDSSLNDLDYIEYKSTNSIDVFNILVLKDKMLLTSTQVKYLTTEPPFEIDFRGTINFINETGELYDTYLMPDSTVDSRFFTITQMEDESFLVGGHYDKHPYLCKLNKDGEFVWDTIFYDIQAGLGALAAGKADTFYAAFSGGGTYLMQMHGKAQKDWVEYYPLTFLKLLPRKEGGFVLAFEYFSNPYKNIFTAIDKDRNPLFHKEEYCLDCHGVSITQLKDSSYVILGCEDTKWWDYLTDIKMVKIDKEGELLWERRFMSEHRESARDIIEMEDGSLMALVRVDQFPDNQTTLTKIQIIKTNCMGLLTEPECSFEYNNLGGQEVLFTNTSLYVYPDSIDGGYYEWDFGDGSVLSNAVNPVHTYTEEGEYTVRLTGIVCSDTSVYEQTVLATPTSVISPASPSSLEDALGLYPNPVEGDVLYFEVGGNYAGQQGRILFYNTLGQLVLQRTFKNKVNLGDLSGGVYFVVVEIGGERIVEKVVVN